MKTLKLLLLLFLFSLQANASGYAHNMFVAHKKLKAGKEAHWVKTKARVPRVTVVRTDTRKVSMIGESKSAVQKIAARVSDMVTLNERILEEAQYYVFRNEEETEADDSVVTRLVGGVKSMVYCFAVSVVGKR